MPGGRHGLQNRRPDTSCRGVGSIPTLSATFNPRCSISLLLLQRVRVPKRYNNRRDRISVLSANFSGRFKERSQRMVIAHGD